MDRQWSRWLLGLVLPSKPEDPNLRLTTPQLMYEHDAKLYAMVLGAAAGHPHAADSDHLIPSAPDSSVRVDVQIGVKATIPPHGESRPTTPTATYLLNHKTPISGPSRTASTGYSFADPLAPIAPPPTHARSHSGSKKLNPSPITLEKAAANALYFEQYYDTLARGLTSARRQRRGRVNVDAFQMGRVIGQGAFGVVHIASEKDGGRIVAIKELRKADLLRMGQEGHVRAEKDLLVAATALAQSGCHTWIPRLHYAFQDVDHVYLVLEYMGGGDLLTLLMNRGSLPEATVRFYAAEMVLALHQAHCLGYIHRDVKPDNFLFTSDGHIRVADFGLATDLHWSHDSSYYEHQRRAVLKTHGVPLSKSAFGNRRRKVDYAAATGGGGGSSVWSMGRNLLTWRNKNRRKLAYTICGTNSYMAPEVIRGQGYGFSADWWGLGVIVYEALYGTVPFMATSRQAARQNILDHKANLVFPRAPRTTSEANDFMRGLLCEPEERLGYTSPKNDPRTSSDTPLGPDGVEQLMSHPWFDGVDWKNLHRQTPPYQPNLVCPDDTQHFDEDIPDEPLAPAHSALDLRDPLLGDTQYGAAVLEIRKNLVFKGWTFRSECVSTSNRRASDESTLFDSSVDFTRPMELDSNDWPETEVPVDNSNVSPPFSACVGEVLPAAEADDEDADMVDLEAYLVNRSPSPSTAYAQHGPRLGSQFEYLDDITESDVDMSPEAGQSEPETDRSLSVDKTSRAGHDNVDTDSDAFSLLSKTNSSRILSFEDMCATTPPHMSPTSRRHMPLNIDVPTLRAHFLHVVDGSAPSPSPDTTLRGQVRVGPGAIDYNETIMGARTAARMVGRGMPDFSGQ